MIKDSISKLLKLTFLFTLGIVFYSPFHAHAQEVTNQALSLTPEQATSLWKECYEEANKTGVLTCELTKGNVETKCNRDAALAGDFCTFTYPDKSRIEADPNLFFGSTFKNYDSSGKLVGTNNEGGIGGEDSGTLKDTRSFDTTCGPADFACNLLKLPGMLFSAIALIVLMFASGILWMAGTVFNWVVIRTVFQFGTYFGTSDSMLLAWGVMRDIANIGLLFGFIFMGVLLILNVDGGGHGHGHGGGISAKHAIPRLIIFAILLNFSLFATQFVIDVANAFSSSFVTLAGQECSQQTSSGQDATGGQSIEDCANNGISGKIIAAAGISKIWQLETWQQMGSNLVDRPYSYTVSLIMLSILVLVTAIVVLAGAIMLIIRVVILSLLMVTSPIGFAGLAIPKLEGIAKQWWDKLISQAFFAPIYLLLIFISVKLTEGLMQGQASLATALIASEGNTVAGNMQVVMVFFIVIGFMAASLILASKMGAMGASYAATFAQRTVTAPFAMAGRASIGAGSAAALKAYERGMARARGQGGVMGTLARSKFAGGVLDDIVAPTLAQGKNMKFGGKSYEEEQKRRKERGEHLDHVGHQAHQEDELNAAIKNNDTATVQRLLQQMGTSDIKDYIKASKADLDLIARNLSPEKFADLMKDKTLDSAKKQSLQNKRFGGLQGAGAGAISNQAGFDAAKAEVKKWSNDDLVEFAKSNPNEFANLINAKGANGESVLSNDQREALEKAKGLNNAQRQMVKDSSLTNRINQAAAGGLGASAGTMAARITNSKEKAKLDTTTLTNTAVIDTFSANDLKEIMSESKLTKTQRNVIMNRVRAMAPTNAEHQKILDYLNNANTDALIKTYWL